MTEHLRYAQVIHNIIEAMTAATVSRKDPLAVALRLLAVRPHACAEVMVKLKKKGFDDGEAARAIEYLANAGYLNDEQFAETLTRYRSRNKGWGPRKIAAELSAKGVARDIINRAVGGLGGEAEAAPIREAVSKWRRKTGAPLPLDNKAFAKAVRHLIGRGFTLPAVLCALKGLRDESEE